MTHLVMFDIDGTLVDSMSFDTELYTRAIRTELGGDIEIDETWRSYHNATDSGILDEILAQRDFGVPRNELRRRVRRRFVALVADYLARNRNTVREIPGAVALVETLLATPGVRVAIATGGWAETAAMKLRAIAMPIDSLAIATSSDAPERTRIMQIAAERALAGAVPRRRTYFGDAPWDRRASRELGFDFVLIGNSFAHEPRFDDYADRGAVLARVLGGGDVLRRAEARDIAAIERVRASVRENRLTSTAISAEDVGKAIEATGRGWVVESDGEVIAFAIGNAIDGNLWALFVHPDHERRGHGRRLHDALVAWLWSRGLERLWLTTEPGTRAERFYEAAGWVRAGLTSRGEVRFELAAPRSRSESPG